MAVIALCRGKKINQQSTRDLRYEWMVLSYELSLSYQGRAEVEGMAGRKLMVPISSLVCVYVTCSVMQGQLKSGTTIAIKSAATPTFSLPNKDSVIGNPNITKLLLNNP